MQIDDTNENFKYVRPHPEFVWVRQPFHSSLRIHVPEDLFCKLSYVFC